MCGLFGATSTYLTTQELLTARQIGALSFLRGEDSCGVAVSVPGKKKSIHYAVSKSVADPYGFLFHPEMKTFFNELDRPSCLIGHCRSATVGAITRENAHPYEVGTIIGAHNGTIQELTPKDGGTDSRELFNLIDKHGIEDVIKHQLDKDAAYALTWFDKTDNTLNFLRNNKRPLFMMNGSGESTFYWASEESFLKVIKERSLTNFGTIRELPENLLHVYKVGSTSPIKVTPLSRVDIVVPKEIHRVNTPLCLLPPFITKPLKEDIPKPVNTAVTRVSINDKISLSSVDRAHTLFPDLSMNEMPHRILVGDHLSATHKTLRYQHPCGQLMSVAQFDSLMDLGCCVSNKKLSWSDAPYWVSDDSYICEEFKDDAFVKEYTSHLLDENLIKSRLGRWVYARVLEIANVNKEFISKNA